MAVPRCGYHSPMKSWLAVAALVFGVGACGSSEAPNANNAAPLCKLTDSPNVCLRCQAQKCPTQLDYCFGLGFHSGELVVGNDASSAAPCAAFSRCVQTCGCLDGCFATCNDQINGLCSSCQQTYFSPCRTQFCSAECSSASDGGS
jgi:hypothetical protein